MLEDRVYNYFSASLSSHFLLRPDQALVVFFQLFAEFIIGNILNADSFIDGHRRRCRRGQAHREGDDVLYDLPRRTQPLDRDCRVSAGQLLPDERTSIVTETAAEARNRPRQASRL